MQNIINKIDASYENNRVERDFLGLSGCGHSCQRYLWYAYNKFKAKKIEGRILRLFKLGDIIEAQVRDDFIKAGYNITSDQKLVKFDWEDYSLSGHIDGIIDLGYPHLWECKSANDRSFKKLIKLGSYKEWNEKYYAQVQFYMLGLDLTDSLVVVYNKNDSSLYCEKIKLDKDYAVKKLQTVFTTISSDALPLRCCHSEDYYEARYCDFKEICWG